MTDLRYRVCRRICKKNFSQVYNGASHGQLNAKSEVFDSYTSSTNNYNNFDQSAISFELIDKCIRNLKCGKASGPDELMAEHLKYAHPILIYNLCILFRAIAVHSFIPNDFDIGLMVPLVKDKTGDINSVDNYRGITLTPGLNVCCCQTVKIFLLLTIYSLVLNVMLVARKLFLH